MSVLDDQIAQLQAALDSKDYSALETAVKDCVSVWIDDIPTIKSGLDRYRGRAVPLGYEVKFDYKGDAEKLIAKLKKHQEKTISARDGHNRTSPNVVVNANPVNIANASASIDATFSSTMAQIWSLSDDILTSSQKQELAKMLQDVESGKDDDGKLRKAGKAVADWLFDNAIKAIPTVMPYISQVINGL